MKKLGNNNIEVGIITNDVSVSLVDTAHIYERVRFISASPGQDKLEVLSSWKAELGLEWSEIAYMGDDEPDLPCLQAVGVSGAPSDALDIVKSSCQYVATEKGGEGAVRSFCDYIIDGLSTRACICIPARVASARLPSKLLLEIDGTPIIKLTCLQCLQTKLPVFVFTGDEEIVSAVTDLSDGITVIRTKGEYENGTERLSRNEHQIPAEFNTVINVQGDEPFVAPENILHALHMHRERKAQTFYTTLHEKCDEASAKDPARVKVAVSDNRAHWYSRSLIPFHRVGCPEISIFTGIYVFSRDKLALFRRLQHAMLTSRER